MSAYAFPSIEECIACNCNDSISIIPCSFGSFFSCYFTYASSFLFILLVPSSPYFFFLLFLLVPCSFSLWSFVSLSVSYFSSSSLSSVFCLLRSSSSSSQSVLFLFSSVSVFENISEPSFLKTSSGKKSWRCTRCAQGAHKVRLSFWSQSVFLAIGGPD